MSFAVRMTFVQEAYTSLAQLLHHSRMFTDGRDVTIYGIS